ncbi:septum site-determining protein Ssd [Angustibacter luteus]|uniref:Septum site-determining protein Ssd n=1 Tax=Angustibacter luteus TaxID=658456 RepID=A0ABW1JDR2_9ACTN
MAQDVWLLSGDEVLVVEVQRLAASAGVRVQVASQLPDRGRWPAGLLLVGADRAGVLARSRGARRADVVVVAFARAGAPEGAESDAAWRHAVALGADQVAVLPLAGEWLLERLARTVEPATTAHVLAVLGGCGGAGASLLAGALAVAGADSGRRTLLVDLDQLGGGLDLALGLDDVPGLRWPELTSARGRLPASSLHESLPRAGSLAVLAAGRGDPMDLPVAAATAVLDAAGRGHELVVLDVGRSLDPVAHAALDRADELLLVVPTRLRAVVAARQLVAALGPRASSVTVVARRRPDERWTGRRVADALGLPLAAVLADDPRLDADLARGVLPGARLRSPSRRAAEQCLARVFAARADRDRVAVA